MGPDPESGEIQDLTHNSFDENIWMVEGTVAGCVLKWKKFFKTNEK